MFLLFGRDIFLTDGFGPTIGCQRAPRPLERARARFSRADWGLLRIPRIRSFDKVRCRDAVSGVDHLPRLRQVPFFTARPPSRP
jgi:hypothetical protein